MLTETIKALSKTEKLLLMNDLWEDISDDLEDSSLSALEKQTLDLRYESFLQNPEEGMAWAEVKSDLRKLL